MPGFREFLRSPNGKIVGIIVAAVAVASLGWSVYSNFHDPNVAAANDVNFICAETGKPFSHTIQVGDKIPLPSPFSGKNTGYPAELCYWTKDGKSKTTPTLILLNQYAKKPGPTFCPDCGRLVTIHNPAPGPSVAPPPTKEQYDARNSN